MRGVTPPDEQAGVVQHGGRGTNRGEPAAGRVLTLDEFADTRIGPEVFHTGTAGQKNAVEIPGKGGGESGVGMEGQTGAAGHVNPFRESGDRHFGTGASQEVNGRGRFDFLETIGKNCENRRHNLTVGRMIPNAPGNFAGKRLVVLGCGYVGSAFAREAVARGMRVTALTRNEAKASPLREAGIETVVADLADQNWHGHIPGGADFVVNCVSSGGGGIEGYRRSYLQGMTSVVAWMRSCGPAGVAVYTSSTSVYPQGGGVRLDESAELDRATERPGVLIAAEEALLGAEDAAARRVVLRLAGIYGPGRHHLLEQVRAGEVAGRGDFHLNLIYRDDLCQALWAVLGSAAREEIFNVADDGAATKGEIVAWLAARLGLASPRFTGEPAGGRRPVTPDRIIGNAQLKTALGWRPLYPTFREGYEKILSL
jgi:nucleoside-diphosphate-sugar epimerase